MAKQNWQVWQRRNDEEAVTVDFAVSQQAARQLMRTSVEAAKAADIELVRLLPQRIRLRGQTAWRQHMLIQPFCSDA